MKIERNGAFPKVTIGIDLGDGSSAVCVVDAAGEVVRRDAVRTEEAILRRWFGGWERARVVIEAGTHSPWVSRLIESLGHEVVVANPSRMRGMGKRKTDRVDAEYLARQGRADVRLCYPIRHRREEAQRGLVAIKSRDVLVRARGSLIRSIRGSAKSLGARIRKCSAEAFVNQARRDLPQELAGAFGGILHAIEELSRRIRAYDKAIEKSCEEEHPETKLLQQVAGVGPVTSLAFVLVIDDAARFKRSRSVGSYLGLVPGCDDSGARSPELPIHKEGDALLRRLLVQSAHYILGPFGPDTDLRRWGLKLADRGGKKAKKRAIVAVARKLAVLLHRLWITGQVYEPLRRAELKLAA
jgi:transposase